MKKLLICSVVLILFANPVFAESEADKVKDKSVSATKNEQRTVFI